MTTRTAAPAGHSGRQDRGGARTFFARVWSNRARAASNESLSVITAGAGEQEARKVFSHVFAMYKVFGGDIQRVCAQRGVPDVLVRRFVAEQAAWDKGLDKFDWDGSAKENSD